MNSDIKTRHYPNLIDAYLAYTEGHESTVRVRKWSIISVIAAALERKVYLNRGYYTLYPNLYVFIIGRSGLIKKSTSTGIAVNLVRELSDIRIMSERMTASSIIEQLSLCGRKYREGEKLLNQSALFAYASELSVFLEEVFGDVSTLLTTFYDCIPNDATKPWVYYTIGRGERKIFGPCLNILGASTKAWLKRCIPRSEMEGGFTSRIMFVVENNLPEKLIAWPEIDDNQELVRLKIVADLKTIHRLVGCMKPTDEARQLFSKWYEHHMRKVLPMTQDPRMVGYMGRKGDTILKLATIHSVAQRDDLIIDKDDLKWAEDEMNVLEPDWRLAFDGMGLKPSLNYEIMELIKKRMRVKKEELLHEVSQTNPMVEVLKAINELKGMDEVISFTRKEDGVDVEYYGVPGVEELPES